MFFNLKSKWKWASNNVLSDRQKNTKKIVYLVVYRLERHVSLMYAARLRVGFLVGPHKSAKFVAGYKVCCFTFSKFLSSDLHFVPQWNEVVSWGMVGIRSLKILYVKHRRFSFPRASNEGNPSSSNIPVIGPAWWGGLPILFQYPFEGRGPR